MWNEEENRAYLRRDVQHAVPVPMCLNVKMLYESLMTGS
jgi:hypothetical protein